jgi:DNA recombination protein RmuC
MTTLELVLGAVVGVLALALVVTVARDGGGDGGVDRDALENSLSSAISEVGLDRTAGQIESHASEMRAVHDDIEQMLRVPQARGSFGERQLEVILDNHLPTDCYGLQEAVVDGKRPDAHVETPAGVVPIDAKFSLDAFERYLAADPESDAARDARRAFADAVETQLEKIRADYVRPDTGTTDFAFAFIPSERVYYHLVTEEYDLLSTYASEGVQVVSPLTLGQKLHLLQAGVHARRLTEQAEAVEGRLLRLAARFEAVAADWDTAMRHLGNAKARADDADAAFDDLRNEFERVRDGAPAPSADGEGDVADAPTGPDDPAGARTDESPTGPD